MRSMTGYAYVCKRAGAQSVQVMLRSVNYKYLDIAVRNLHRDNIVLEEEIKREIQKKIYRGKIEVHIFLKGPMEGEAYIDEKLLASYASAARRLAKKYQINDNLGLSDLLGLPHVVCWEEKSGADAKVILPAVKEAAARLLEFRKREGKIIRKEILANLSKLKQNAEKICRDKPGAEKDQSSREDIDEEASLIAFYVGKLEKTVAVDDEEPKGKSLDFLVQEILRELNAASSKTKRKALGSLIVESKNYLERIREQVQNVE